MSKHVEFVETFTFLSFVKYAIIGSFLVIGSLIIFDAVLLTATGTSAGFGDAVINIILSLFHAA